MIDLTELKKEWIINLQKLIDKAISENKKVKLLEEGICEPDLENLSVDEDVLFEYEQTLAQLMYDTTLKHYNYTDDDFHFVLKFYKKYELFLKQNLENEELTNTHLESLENPNYGILAPSETAFSKQQEVFGDDEKNYVMSETKKENEPRSPYWLKKELASTIGITICGKCGTRTKMKKTERDPHQGWYGYTICPKCGHKEQWYSEFSY